MLLYQGSLLANDIPRRCTRSRHWPIVILALLPGRAIRQYNLMIHTRYVIRRVIDHWCCSSLYQPQPVANRLLRHCIRPSHWPMVVLFMARGPAICRRHSLSYQLHQVTTAVPRRCTRPRYWSMAYLVFNRDASLPNGFSHRCTLSTSTEDQAMGQSSSPSL